MLAWPFLAFGTIFIFDAPIRSWLDEVVRYSAAGAILSYPVVWGFAFWAARRVKEQPDEEGRLALLSLAPFAWIGIGVVLMKTWDYFGRHNL